MLKLKSRLLPSRHRSSIASIACRPGTGRDWKSCCCSWVPGEKQACASAGAPRIADGLEKKSGKQIVVNQGENGESHGRSRRRLPWPTGAAGVAAIIALRRCVPSSFLCCSRRLSVPRFRINLFECHFVCCLLGHVMLRPQVRICGIMQPQDRSHSRLCRAPLASLLHKNPFFSPLRPSKQP